MILKKDLATIILFAVLFITPFGLHAQTVNDLSLGVTPSLPGAYEGVEIRLSSYSVDLSRSQIIWYVNDVSKAEETGLTTFKTKTGALGKPITVRASVKTQSGSKFSRSITFVPAEVDIVWSAHTYTPPFYKGKALASSESLIRLYAIANIVDSNGKRLTPNQLTYNWEQDGIRLGKISGVGKDGAVLQALPVPNARSYITVTVSKTGSSLQAKNTLVVRTANPAALFYEKHPLEGSRYNKALTAFEFPKGEATIRIEPYFFSLDDVQNKKIEYQWFINNKVTTPSDNNQELTLRHENDARGLARIIATITNHSRLVQDAENNLNINF